MDFREQFEKLVRDVKCLKVANRTTTTGGGGGDSFIDQNVANYSELQSGTTIGSISYVRGSEGTPWLPGTMGGTYYPKGWYVWNGSTWVSDRNAIANQLQVLVDFSHTQNTDTKLAEGTQDEVTASEIRNHIDTDFARHYAASTLMNC